MSDDRKDQPQCRGTVNCLKEKPWFEWVWDPPPADGKNVRLAYGGTVTAELGSGWPQPAHFYHVAVVGPVDPEHPPEHKTGNWDKETPRCVWDWKDGAWRETVPERYRDDPKRAEELHLDAAASTQTKLVFVNQDKTRDEGMLFEPMVLAAGKKLNPDPEVILQKDPSGGG